MEAVDLRKYFHNITMTLENYRALTSFCENAVDSITWEINGFSIPTRLINNAERALTTVDIKVHIDNQLKKYQEVCKIYRNERRYNIIRYKYLDWPGKGENKQFPYTNEELADFFDCSIDTVQREVKQAKKELKIFMFGVDAVSLAE